MLYDTLTILHLGELVANLYDRVATHNLLMHQ